MNALDALGLAFLIIAGGCALALLFGIIEGIATAILRPGGLLDRIKRR